MHGALIGQKHIGLLITHLHLMINKLLSHTGLLGQETQSKCILLLIDYHIKLQGFHSAGLKCRSRVAGNESWVEGHMTGNGSQVADIQFFISTM